MEGQGHFTAFPQIGSVEKMKIPVLECWGGHAEAKRASHVADMAEDKGTFTVLYYFLYSHPTCKDLKSVFNVGYSHFWDPDKL